jgi:hypothetical protein
MPVEQRSASRTWAAGFRAQRLFGSLIRLAAEAPVPTSITKRSALGSEAGVARSTQKWSAKCHKQTFAGPTAIFCRFSFNGYHPDILTSESKAMNAVAKIFAISTFVVVLAGANMTLTASPAEAGATSKSTSGNSSSSSSGSGSTEGSTKSGTKGGTSGLSGTDLGSSR